MRVRTKFYLGALVSSCLIILFILFLIHTTVSVSKQNEHRFASRNVQKAVSELDILTYDYLIHHETRPKRQWHIRYASLGKSLKVLRNYSNNEKELKLAKQLSENYNIVGKTFSEIESNYAKRQSLITNNVPQERIDNSLYRENRLATQLLIASQSMIIDASMLAEKDVKDLLSIITVGRNLVFFLTFVLLLVATYISVSVSRTMGKSLDILRIGAGEIGRGNLNYKIEVNSKNEIGIVANVLNQLAGNLKKVTASKSSLQKEITEREKAEKALIQSEKYIMSIINSIPQQVYVANAQGVEVYSNSIRLRFFNSKDIVKNKTLEMHLFPEDRQRRFNKWQESMSTGQNYEIEYRLKDSKTKNYQWFLTRAIPIRNEKNEITSWFGTATNIDDQKKLEQRKDEFMNTASHELKTPLTSLKAYAQLVLKELGQENTKNKYFAENISRQVDKLTELVNNLLDVRKIESGKFEYTMIEFDLKNLIETVVADIQYTTSTHEIIKGGVKSAIILGDREKIGQVLVNLLTNAVKYSPDASKVIIKSHFSIKGDKITTSIEDFGLGIDKEDLDKIFDRFYQIRENKNISGFGLGLHISSEIIKNHGSKLIVESVKGKGSIFSFTLPVVKKEVEK